jgi:hypothetical protein
MNKSALLAYPVPQVAVASVIGGVLGFFLGGWIGAIVGVLIPPATFVMMISYILSHLPK